MLDKGRATLAGKQGDFMYACPLDQEFLTFVGIDPEKLRDQLATGKSDGEILAWISANALNKRNSAEIEAWSYFQDRRTPGELGKREYFHNLHKEIAQNRTDIVTWFDLLDLDDHVSYGGKA